MKSGLTMAFALVGLVAGSTNAFASTIVYDNGAPNGVTFYFADANSANTTVASSFSLQTDTVTDAHWWGACAFDSACAGTFRIGFYNDNSGTIGSLIQQFDVGNANQTATGGTVGPSPEYSYDAVFSPVSFTPGQTYWFTVGRLTGGGVWGQESTYGDGNHLVFIKGFGWQAMTSETELAFNLTADAEPVPEPSTLWLLGLGLAVGTYHRYRRAHV